MAGPRKTSSGFSTMSPYVDSFMDMGEDWRTKHSYQSAPSQTYVPMDSQAPGMKTNNMKLGDPTNLTDTRSNPLVAAKNALTDPPGLTIDAAVRARNKTVTDGIDGGFDYYQSGINKAVKHYGDYASTQGKDISRFYEGSAPTGAQSVPTQDGKPWYGSLPDTRGQTNYNPNAPRPKLGRTVTEEDLDTMKDISYAQDNYARERRSISGPNSMYTSSVGQASSPNPVQSGELSTTMGGADNLANLGIEEFDLSKPPPPPGFLSDEQMSSILEAPIPEATEILDVAQDSDSTAPTSTDPLRRLRDMWANKDEVPDVPAEEAAGKLGDKLGKALAFAPLVTGAVNFHQNQQVIGDLRTAKTKALGARGDLANQREAESDAISDQLGEDRRRTGELEKNRMRGDLRKIAQYKGGGLSSGSAVEAAEDVLDTAHARTDITLADLYEKSSEAQTTVLDKNRETRQKLTEQIDTLDAKIDEMQKQQITGPIKAFADVGSNLLMASNPALAIGMKVGSSLLG